MNEEKANEEKAEAFFAEGRTYVRYLPYRAPEDTPGFMCERVTTPPGSTQWIAFGFWRRGKFSPWNPAWLTQREWADDWVIDPNEPQED